MSMLSKTAIDQLGVRLRKATVPQISDLRLLQDYRAGFGPACDAVAQKLVKLLGAEPSSRIKTLNTLIDKLRRDKTRLSTMQDVVGVRFVRDIRLSEQTDEAILVSALFPGSRIDDRREKPSHGYRAMHVIVEEQGRLVEIQIRTELQHLWASMFELASNLWGRQVRYGAVPDDPGRTVSESLGQGAGQRRGDQVRAKLARARLPDLTRASVVQTLGVISEKVAQLEEFQDRLAGHDRSDLPSDDPPDEADVTRLRDAVRELDEKIRNEMDVTSRYFRAAKGTKP